MKWLQETERLLRLLMFLEIVRFDATESVIVCTEEYTSKTCGHCSHVHGTLGSAKKFKCPHCNIVLDRDGNGARNICLLKRLRALLGSASDCEYCGLDIDRNVNSAKNVILTNCEIPPTELSRAVASAQGRGYWKRAVDVFTAGMKPVETGSRRR